MWPASQSGLRLGETESPWTATYHGPREVVGARSQRWLPLVEQQSHQIVDEVEVKLVEGGAAQVLKGEVV